MDEKQLQQLFRDAEPPIATDADFMHRLERNLNAVESVRTQRRTERARTRTAVVVAALVGFCTGVLLTLSLPYLGTAVITLLTGMCHIKPTAATLHTLTVVGYALCMAAALLAAMATYDIALLLPAMRQTRPPEKQPTA